MRIAVYISVFIVLCLGVALAAFGLDRAILATSTLADAAPAPPVTAATFIRSPLPQGGFVTRHRARAAVREQLAVRHEAQVIAIEERHGVVAVGTSDDGAWIFRGPERTPEHVTVDDRVNDLAIAADGRVSLATNGGAYEISPVGQARRLASGVFTAVAVHEKRTWFASPRGLAVLTDHGFWNHGVAQGFPADRPQTLASCGAHLCVGAMDGLWLFDGETARRRTIAPAATVMPVSAIAFARGETWVGTFDAGLVRLSLLPRRFAAVDGLSEIHVAPQALAIEDETAYAGTPSGLLRIRPERTRRATPSAKPKLEAPSISIVEDLGEGPVTAVAPASGRGLWVGVRGSVRRVEIAELPACTTPGCG